MAIYRLSAQVVKRSAGGSVVACAAYRAGQSLDDERTGQTFDYTRKRGVLHEAIITPENAPAWMADREQLWNGVEAVEKRVDARLAREVQLALPHELTDAQRAELVENFVRDEFVSRGMVADIAIHTPGRVGDERNYHAHVLLTTRAIVGDHFGDKCRAWDRADQLVLWREHWAETVNLALEREGIEARIDHRSLAAQGLDREPEIHIGPAAMEMERRGVETDRGDQLRAVLERNEGRILVGEIAAPEPAPDGGRISARDPADGQTDFARDLPAQDTEHAHEQHGHHHEEGGRELLGIATHGLMSHAVVGGVVESLAGFFLDHGAGAAAEAVHEIGEAVEHIGEAREGFEAVKVVTAKGHDAGGGRHRIPHDGKAHEVNPTAPAQAAQEQQVKDDQQAAHDRELAAFLKQRAAERQQFEKDDDFGLDL